MNWITSDFHLYHNNIIKYCDRPFNDYIEMNRTIVENWNRVVKEEDTVYYLGDFALTSKEKLKEVRSWLPGKIIFILGNHDRSKQSMLDCGFEEVHDYLVLGDNKLILMD